ncbi:MAG: hypothetical protein PVH68_18105 [Armatimonadota bacterium]
MLVGQHRYTVDEKGRVPLCADHVPHLTTGALALTAGYNQCIWILNQKDFEAARAGLKETELLNPKSLRLRRQFLGCVEYIAADGQHRIRIPELLREIAGITGKKSQVVMVGVGQHIECWEKGRWLQYRKSELTDDNLVEDARVMGLWSDGVPLPTENGGEPEQ